MKQTEWGAVIVDICVIIMAVFVSVWQENPRFLWLLAILALTGGYRR